MSNSQTDPPPQPPSPTEALRARLRLHAYDLVNGGTNASDLRNDLNEAATALHTLAAALNPFGSCGEWGRVKVWIANGAPTRDEGIASAAQITKWQVAVDAALHATPTVRPPARPALAPLPEAAAPPTLERDLASVLNRYSAENASNTPDFILAQFLLAALAAWNTGVQQRETWYGRDARPTSTTDITGASK